MTERKPKAETKKPSTPAGVLCETCGAMKDEAHAHKLPDGTIER